MIGRLPPFVQELRSSSFDVNNPHECLRSICPTSLADQPIATHLHVQMTALIQPIGIVVLKGIFKSETFTASIPKAGTHPRPSAKKALSAPHPQGQNHVDNYQPPKCPASGLGCISPTSGPMRGSVGLSLIHSQPRHESFFFCYII